MSAFEIITIIFTGITAVATTVPIIATGRKLYRKKLILKYYDRMVKIAHYDVKWFDGRVHQCFNRPVALDENDDDNGELKLKTELEPLLKHKLVTKIKLNHLSENKKNNRKSALWYIKLADDVFNELKDDEFPNEIPSRSISH